MKNINSNIEILKIYKDLVIKFVSKRLAPSYIRRIYIEYLKLYLASNAIIPSSQYNKNKFTNSNCYGFALDIPTPNIFKSLYEKIEIDDFVMNPGFASFEPFSFKKINTLKNILADFDSLNIKYFESSLEIPNLHNGYKIAILFNGDSYKTHFIRQNLDGTWSEKVGYSNMIRNFTNIDESYYIKLGYTLEKVYEIVKPHTREKVKNLTNGTNKRTR